MSQSLYKGPHPLGVAYEEGGLFRAFFLLQAIELLCDDRIGFFPGDRGEFIGTFRSDPLQWCFDPVRMVDILPRGSSF